MAPKKASKKLTVTGKENFPEQSEPANVQQRKVSRGSRRRIVKALDVFEAAVDVLVKELDLQIFVADKDGKRIGPWPVIAGIKQGPEAIRTEVMNVLK